MAMQFGVFTIRADGLNRSKGRQFEASVLGMMHAMNNTKSGRALMNGFRAVRREVLVFPYDGSMGQCNAYATSDWGMYRNKVAFSPQGWSAHSACAAQGPAGNTPMEVLFHELVHALRFAAKTLQKRATAAQEEEIAILVTNIFSSEMNRPLRWRHSGFNKLPNSDPVAFYGNHFPLIKMFVKEHPTVSEELSDIWTKFNPVREFYDREL